MPKTELNIKTGYSILNILNVLRYRDEIAKAKKAQEPIKKKENK